MYPPEPGPSRRTGATLRRAEQGPCSGASRLIYKYTSLGLLRESESEREGGR